MVTYKKEVILNQKKMDCIKCEMVKFNVLNWTAGILAFQVCFVPLHFYKMKTSLVPVSDSQNKSTGFPLLWKKR